MQGIANDILANPNKYSVDMLKRGMESGSIPPYVAIPAIQEILRLRKQMQGAPDPQAAQQPPIAQQVMQEADAIAALPTNLPAQYAGGGIVAFADGGEVERYQFGGMIPSSMVRYGLARTLGADASRYDVPRREDVEDDRDRRSKTSSPEMEEAIFRQQESRGPIVTPTPAATPQRRATAPAAPQAGIAALPGAAVAAPTSAPPMLGELSGPSNLRRAETAVADMRGLADMEEQFATQGIRDLRSQLTGKPFEEYRQRLENEAKQSGVERADAKNLAFVKAGLAMMAGTSQHALVNIGQGAMAGVADWQAAVKDLKKADRERSKEMALIDQAARAEQRGDVKDQMSALERARDRGIAFESSMTNMLINAGFADNQRAAERVLAQFNADANIFRTREQIAADERIARERNQTTLQAAGIQAEAARDRAAARPAIPPSVANQINREVGEKVPQIRQDVLKSLGLTEKGLSDASRAIVDRTVQERIQQEIDQRVQSNLRISAGISGLAPTPTAGRPTMEVVRQRPVPQ
jgi:hypothetical protein